MQKLTLAVSEEFFKIKFIFLRKKLKYYHFLVLLNFICVNKTIIYIFTTSFVQQKIRSTAVVTTCSLAAFAGIGVYKNNENVYDDFLMPIVRLFSPEFCHRAAVLGFKYRIFPKQQSIDSERLVNS